MVQNREKQPAPQKTKSLCSIFESRGFLLTFEFGGEHGHTPSLPLSCYTTLLEPRVKERPRAPGPGPG
jgi:hypothetical protein